jgi:hypothetical protein
LQNKGKQLAAEFLETKDPKLGRSFLVLYCKRKTRTKNKGLGTVTTFLALGPLSCENGLPKFDIHTDLALESGDALLVGNEMPQMCDMNEGGGFALISEWSA